MAIRQRNPWRSVVPAMVLLAFTAAAHADEVSVAVAANFRAAMEYLAPEFKRATGHDIVASYGSTGKFYAQIRNGAPFDVLLAADSATPERLEQENAAVGGSRFTYAVGTLALWSAQPGRVDNRGDILRTSPGAPAGFDHLALADPKLAPYGAAAAQTLQALGLNDALQPRVVLGEDINQAYQFVASGNATIGFVALSQVMRKGEITGGSVWVVPRNLYTPIRQDAVILPPGRDKPAARALMKFLRSEVARVLIAGFGYSAP